MDAIASGYDSSSSSHLEWEIGPSPDEERGVGGSVNDGEAGVAFRSWVVDAAPEVKVPLSGALASRANGVAMGSPCDIDDASFKAAFSASQGVSRNSGEILRQVKDAERRASEWTPECPVPPPPPTSRLSAAAAAAEIQRSAGEGEGSAADKRGERRGTPRSRRGTMNRF